MSLGIFPIFQDKAVVATDWCDEGVPLLEHMEKLDSLAEKLDLLPLGSFNPYPDVNIPEGFDGDPSELVAKTEKAWYFPAKGLSTVTGLLDALKKNPKPLPEAVVSEVTPSLECLKNALESGIRKKSKFHLDVL